MSFQRAVGAIVDSIVLLAGPVLAVAAQDVATAQRREPIRTTICDLLNEPEQFNGKMVTRSGASADRTEDFRLDASQCDANKRMENNVWLVYGFRPLSQGSDTRASLRDHGNADGTFRFSRRPNARCLAVSGISARFLLAS